MVFVTGSTKGNEIARQSVQWLLSRQGIKSKFVHPQNWDYARKSLNQMQGLILLGGKDIDPMLYGEAKTIRNGAIDSKRDIMELALLDEANKRDLPTFGICRGMQMINVYYGGTLYPHLNDLSLEKKHRNNLLPLKQIRIVKDSKLWNIIGKDKIRVNALHHQGIERLGNAIMTSAYDNNSIVQAIEHKNAEFMLGVQWHPEYMPYSRSSSRFFHAFCSKVKSRSNLKN